MKKILITTLTAATLIGVLITAQSNKSQANEQVNKRACVIVGYRPTYRAVYDDLGNLQYRTEDDYVIDLYSASVNALPVVLGERYSDVNVKLRAAGYRHEGISYGIEKWVK